MSMPKFPTVSPAITREEAINQIIASIAMEELSLSHIINAEGEKLQYVLGTLEGRSGPGATIDDVLKVNDSVRGVLQSAAETQSLLRNKLQTALCASVLTGPTGATGGTGPRCAVIPFGTPQTEEMATGDDGERSAVAFIGFGNNTLFNAADDPITGPNNIIAFSAPRDGDITALSVGITTLAATVGATHVTAQIYTAEANGKEFSPVDDAIVEFDIPAGSLAGTPLSGIVKLKSPIKAQTRIALVVFPSTEGGTRATVDLEVNGGLEMEFTA